MKNRFKTKALALSGVLLASTSIGLASVSCSCSVDKLFFEVEGKDLKFTFCDRGASIYSIQYKDQYITYHPKNKNDFLRDDFYHGKGLGRVAGRIKDGKFNIGNKDYKVEVNETSGKKNNTLHGGQHGFSTKDFKRYIETTNDFTKVSFNYVSPANECGFPEVVDAWFVYTIYKNENKFDINIFANSTGKTPINLTTHPYFRLGNDGDIKDHHLELPADKLATFERSNEDQVVVGEEPVNMSAEGAFDFRTAKPIGKDIAKAKEFDKTSGGYDHIWKFSDSIPAEQHYLKLYNPKTNITLTCNTDADAFIVYTNCYPHETIDVNPSGKDSLYSGMTIEPITFFRNDEVEEKLCITPDKPFSRSISYTLEGLN